MRIACVCGWILLASAIVACGGGDGGSVDGGTALDLVTADATSLGGDASPLDSALSEGAGPSDVAPDVAVDATPDIAMDATAGGDALLDVGPSDVGPVPCPAEVSCSDGLLCTIDTCEMPGALCKWTFAPNTCLIGGVCREAGDTKPGDTCAACVPTSSHVAWTPLADGATCTDGDACTLGESCLDHTCDGGTTLTCDDGNTCTSDICDPAKGCTYPAKDEAPCDDGDPCTVSDTCVDAACEGSPATCDDGNPCTDDACDLAIGCTSTANDAPCSDGDPCTAGDTCTGGACVKGDPANCNDGNVCTIDLCDALAGCYHLPTQSPCCVGQTSICDDGNPCTNDLCDPATGDCSHPFNTAVCDDGNACTTGDVCAEGVCAGKGAPACSDGNPCTADSCSPTSGCVHTASNGLGCDDGNPCTQGDTCTNGVCKGTGECACTPSFSLQATRLNGIAIGESGQPGEGLDLDDSASTCAPAGKCSKGIDNATAVLAGLANGSLEKSVASGSLSLLLEYRAFKQGPIELALHSVKLDPGNAACDVQTQSCAWLVSPSLLDPKTCAPTVVLAGTLTGTAVAAGSKGTKLPFTLPVQSGVALPITIYGARIQGNVTMAGTTIAALDGILGGAIPKTELLDAIDSLPDEGLPVPKDLIKAIIDSSLEVDIDSNNDGVLDAVSIGLKIKGIAGTIAGVQG